MITIRQGYNIPGAWKTPWEIQSLSLSTRDIFPEDALQTCRILSDYLSKIRRQLKQSWARGFVQNTHPHVPDSNARRIAYWYPVPKPAGRLSASRSGLLHIKSGLLDSDLFEAQEALPSILLLIIDTDRLFDVAASSSSQDSQTELDLQSAERHGSSYRSLGSAHGTRFPAPRQTIFYRHQIISTLLDCPRCVRLLPL